MRGWEGEIGGRAAAPPERKSVGKRDYDLVSSQDKAIYMEEEHSMRKELLKKTRRRSSSHPTSLYGRIYPPSRPKGSPLHQTVAYSMEGK